MNLINRSSDAGAMTTILKNRYGKLLIDELVTYNSIFSKITPSFLLNQNLITFKNPLYLRWSAKIAEKNLMLVVIKIESI